MGDKKGFRFQLRPSDSKIKPPVPRRAEPGIGHVRKIACLGGASSLRFAPWFDHTWELWSHASCRHLCKRDPDLLWDLHPKSLWADPSKKTWDPKYLKWLAVNRVPIMMQEVFPEAPASIRFPIETCVTEWPRRYMTNHLSYMIALALMEGVTHLAVYGCDYNTNSEYGPQRGGAEYWCGIAEGRGVQLLIAPECDLLGKPKLLYGYESHPNGSRDKSYSFAIGPLTVNTGTKGTGHAPVISALDPNAPALRNIGVPPDPHGLERALELLEGVGICPSVCEDAAGRTTISPLVPRPGPSAPSAGTPLAKSKCPEAASAPPRPRATNGTRTSKLGPVSPIKSPTARSRAGR